MFVCPNCSVSLVRTSGPAGVVWMCPSCAGRSATISLLRRNIPQNVVNDLWQTARSGDFPRKRHCPACHQLMAEVPARGEHGREFLDVCTVCQFVWFDSQEYEALPVLPRAPTADERLPQEARERLAILELDGIRERAEGGDGVDETPDEWWQWIPGVLGLPVERDTDPVTHLPLVTWSLAVLVSVVSAMAFSNREAVIQALGLMPSQFGRYGGMTFVTSFFLHAGVIHLISNMYFLLVFGDNVEDWLGKWRFMLLLVCSSLAGDMAHILGDPRSTLSCVGASGGISGIVAFYALKCPQGRLGYLFRAYVWIKWVYLPAYAMFAMWLAIQVFGTWMQLAGFGHVSSLAHLGGASVGLIFWFLTRKE